jgi:hypothetical protein
MIIDTASYKLRIRKLTFYQLISISVAQAGLLCKQKWLCEKFIAGAKMCHPKLVLIRGYY